MQRRFYFRNAAAVGAVALLGSACQAGEIRFIAPDPDALVHRPASQLALALADLPPGYEVLEELRPPPVTRPDPGDPWGRLSSYSIIFSPSRSAAIPVPAERRDGGALVPGLPPQEVVSSVNAYAGVAQARVAFTAWEEAIPRPYQRQEPAGKQWPDLLAVYCHGERPQCLVGFRSHNVIASIAVSGAGGAPGSGAVALVEVAVRLARLMVARIDAVAGR